jgi:hypothetical protein
VIVTEQFGLIPDGKGVKVRGFNCDKKQGLQVSEKQLISPWDLLEGHKNPAPLSFHWFQAGLEKPGFLKKNSPVGFLGFFWGFLAFFLYICPEESVFRVFQFQEYFKVHPDFKL